MLRCHIHRSTAKNKAAITSRPNTRGVGFQPARTFGRANQASTSTAASPIRQNAEAVGPMPTHFTNTADVLISTAPSAIAASEPRV